MKRKAKAKELHAANAVYADLMTPKYRTRVVKNKKRANKKQMRQKPDIRNENGTKGEHLFMFLERIRNKASTLSLHYTRTNHAHP